MERNVLIVRVLAVAGLLAALAVVLTQLTGGGGYKVTANFRDAGQLVKGGVVQVGGRTVGTISDISLSDEGLAAIEMDLDDTVEPLRRGTGAKIRALGLSGIANRFIDLSPGPESGEPIGDGGELGLTETNGAVDLDAVLSSLDPGTRKDLQSLLRNGGKLFADGAAQDTNRALKYLDPALGQAQALTNELTRDTTALTSLLRTGASTAGVLADRRDDLTGALDGTAATLRAVGDEQAALGRLLVRAPAAMRSSAASLARIGTFFDRISPAFDDLSKATPALAQTLRVLPPTARQLRPVLGDLAATLPQLDTALRKIPALAAVAIPAVRSATTAIGEAQPIFEGLRPYAPDIVTGLANGFGGGAGNTYDANGHLARISLLAGGANSGGLISVLSGAAGNAVGPLKPQTGFTARCPGATAPKLGDGSNPFIVEGTLCEKDQVRP